MSPKSFFPNTTNLVTLGLTSLCSRNPHLHLDAPNRIIHTPQNPQKVSIISGGGAGHEPAWSGYVGTGLLSASISGEIFASPSTKQIVAAMELVPSERGVILCITNYTGDCLHFGLAKEKMAGKGKVGLLRMTDDVGLGRSRTGRVGRRGLAGCMFVLKLCGAAAEEDYDFEVCMKVGEATNECCVTIGSSLDYCHIPGRAHHESLPEDTLSVAQGIHNEAGKGLHEVSPIPSPEELVKSLLKYLLDDTDTDRAFVPFASGDEVALLVNNFGGVSTLEMEALTQLTLDQLDKDWDIKPARVFAQCFETSLNAPGFSISLLNLSGVAEKTGMDTGKLWGLLDKETNAPAWPKNAYAERRVDSPVMVHANVASTEHRDSEAGPKVSLSILESALRKACEATLAAEPDITMWDTIMGDGDCGEAVEGMCNAVLKLLSSGIASEHDGALFPILDAIEGRIEEIGGTLGAIISIILASWTSELRNAYRADTGLEFGEKVAGECAGRALRNLQTYTPARVGGRTVMDTLIPFCETLESKADFKKAVEEGVKGADKTEGMPAVYGRATYVGDKVEGSIPRDPGAWAAAVFLKGLLEGLS